MSANDINSPKPSDVSQMAKIARIKGTAAPEPGQGTRKNDSGSNTATLSGRGTMEQK